MLANTLDAFVYDNRGLTAIKRMEKQQKNAGLKIAAQQFEAVFINMLFKQMRQAMPKGELFHSNAINMMQSMQDEQTAQTLAKRGIGLADMLVRQLSPRHQVNQLNDSALAKITNVSSRSLAQQQKVLPLKSFIPSSAYSLTEPVVAVAQLAPHVASFLQKIGPVLLATAKQTGISAKLMVAQAALETNWGRSISRHADGSSSHNWFGIKATHWQGKKVRAMTQEFYAKRLTTEQMNFRSYNSDAHALADYAALITQNPRYAQIPHQNPEIAARLLQQQGYATDPNYAQKLIQIMQQLPADLEQTLAGPNAY